MKDFFEVLVKIVGLFSVSAIILSIFHELGFYQVVGAEFGQFLSTSDYIASVIMWLPQAIYFAFVAAVIHLMVNGPRWNTLVKYPDVKPLTTIHDRIIEFIYWFTLAVAALGTLIGPPSLFITTFNLIVWVVVFLWLWTFNYLVSKIEFIGVLPKSILTFLLFAPVLVTNSYLSGVHEAYRAFFRVPNAYAVDQSKPNIQRNLVLLRSLEKGILARDTMSSRTEFIKWDQINSVTKVGGGPRIQPLSCDLFRVLCDAPPNP